MTRIVNGFTVKNWRNLKPAEDCYGFSKNGSAIAVADQITRDPRRTPVLIFPENAFDVLGCLGAARFFSNYKSKSQKEIAGLVCDLFALNDWKEKTPEAVLRELVKINEAAGRLNDFNRRIWGWKGFDYLEKDIPGCVAAGAIEDKGEVNYFYVGDCGVCVLDKFGYLRFKTPNEGPNSKGSIDDDVKKRFGTGFRDPKGRRIIRSQYRNNPSNPLSYGALTGETSALEYIRTGQTCLEEGDFLLAYSDGLENVIDWVEFRKTLVQETRRMNFGVLHDKLKKFCKSRVKTEGTLVYLIR